MCKRHRTERLTGSKIGNVEFYDSKHFQILVAVTKQTPLNARLTLCRLVRDRAWTPCVRSLKSTTQHDRYILITTFLSQCLSIYSWIWTKVNLITHYLQVKQFAHNMNMHAYDDGRWNQQKLCSPSRKKRQQIVNLAVKWITSNSVLFHYILSFLPFWKTSSLEALSWCGYIR